MARRRLRVVLGWEQTLPLCSRGEDEVLQELVQPLPAGPIRGTAGPSKQGTAGCILYSRRIYPTVQSRYNHAGTGRPILLHQSPLQRAPSQATAGSVSLQPALLKHPRYSPGTSRSTPQHPRPGGRPVATATALPITTATPSGRHSNRPPRQPGPRPRRCHGRVPPPAAVAPDAPPCGAGRR